MNKIGPYQNIQNQTPDLNCLLLHACLVNNPKEVERLLGEKADPNVKNCYNETPLLIACERKNIETILLLIGRGADPTIKGPNQVTPLSHMCQTDMRDAEGNTILHLACQKGFRDLVALLIENGADIEAVNNKGYTPLHLACKHNRKDEAQVLIKNNADIEAEDTFGRTPLHLVCKKGHKDMAKFLIDKGADIEATTYHTETPLILACVKRDVDLAVLLIEMGADIEAKVGEAWTSLHLACSWGFKDLALTLIQKGANPLTRGMDQIAFDLCKNDKTIEYCIEKLETKSVFSFLDRFPYVVKPGKEVKNKLILMQRGEDGESLLHWACKNDKSNIVKLLLKKGLDPLDLDKHNKSPRDYTENSEIHELLDKSAKVS